MEIDDDYSMVYYFLYVFEDDKDQSIYIYECI